MVQQRETALAKVNRRQMAQLLEQGKEESAKIRVENIIRQDISVELMEILELYCELLLARVQLMEAKYVLPSLPPTGIRANVRQQGVRSRPRGSHQIHNLCCPPHRYQRALTSARSAC